MLALTLEKLANVPHIEDIDVRIFLDWKILGRVEEVTWIRDNFLPTAEVFEAKPHIKVLSGTWNILKSLQAGFETGKEFVFLVEEDILVVPSFCDWHWSTHESGDYFVTCGREYNRMGPDFYSNPGTCYRREKLALVMPHINDTYFSGTEAYVNKQFPSQKGRDGSLDDGLIRKVIRSVGGKVTCANPPVAFHQGFHYYDRIPGYRNEGKTIQEKIQCLREILGRISKSDRYTSDYEPYQ